MVAENTDTRLRALQPPSEPSQSGLWLPAPLVVTLLLAAAGVAVSFVFATKGELAAHANRMTVAEETLKHHASAIAELKSIGRATEANVRTLLLRNGVPEDRIATPDSMKE